MNAEQTFKEKAPLVMKWLMRDCRLLDYQAAGILGNIGHECLGFTTLREIGQPGDFGGWGWSQWTGPRAHSFRDWCDGQGLDWKSDAANYGYLKHELKGAYAYCVAAVAKAKSAHEAAVAFERTYERAGVPAYESRQRWADLDLAAYRAFNS